MVYEDFISVVLGFIIYWYFWVSEGKKNNDFTADKKGTRQRLIPASHSSAMRIYN